MYKSLYSHFLNIDKSRLHFASHSHHFWPDVTRDAQLLYWDDTARYIDDKWTYFYSEILPPVNRSICQILDINDNENIVFAPNTHELVFRLLSSLNWKEPINILTTDSEFYSFHRQITRLTELGNFEITQVPTEPFDTFEDRFSKAITDNPNTFDFVFFSQVFFNSGIQCDYRRIINTIPEKTIVCLDGYHGFMAYPTSLKEIQERCFYVAGGYKYAQAGEGACFMVVPDKFQGRPFNTGWYAELSTLHLKNLNEVPYPTNAQQFAGSTMDFSAIYRMKSVFELWERQGITVHDVDKAIKSNMKAFLDGIKRLNHSELNMKNLMMRDFESHGHFLTFNLVDEVRTNTLVEALKAEGILVDSRKNRIRFGFGMYHDLNDIEMLLEKVIKITR